MSEDKGKWGYLVTSTVVTGVIGYFLPKALDSILPWLSENPLSQYPVETVGIAVAASLVGFWTGTAFGRKSSQKRLQRDLNNVNEETLDGFKKICATCYLDENGNLVEPLIFSLDENELAAVDLTPREIKLSESSNLVTIDRDTFKMSVERFNFDPPKNVDVVNGEAISLRFANGKKTIYPKMMTVNEAYGNVAMLACTPCFDFGIVRLTEKGRDLAMTLKIKRLPHLFEYIDNHYAPIEK